MFSNEKFGVRGYLRWSLLLKCTVTKIRKIITIDLQQIYSPINENGVRLD
jgi:cytochrome c oxidase subunit IV